MGSVKSVLEDMLIIYESLKTTHDKNNQKEWIIQIDSWREKKSLDFQNSKEVIKPQYVVQELYKVTNGDAL